MVGVGRLGLGGDSLLGPIHTHGATWIYMSKIMGTGPSYPTVVAGAHTLWQRYIACTALHLRNLCYIGLFFIFVIKNLHLKCFYFIHC